MFLKIKENEVFSLTVVRNAEVETLPWKREIEYKPDPEILSVVLSWSSLKTDWG